MFWASCSWHEECKIDRQTYTERYKRKKRNKRWKGAVKKVTLVNSKPGGSGLAACVQHDTGPVTADDTAWCVDSEAVEPVRSCMAACLCVVAVWGRGWHAYPKKKKKCHEANDTPSTIFRIVTSKIKLHSSVTFIPRMRRLVCAVAAVNLYRST